MQEDTLLI